MGMLQLETVYTISGVEWSTVFLNANIYNQSVTLFNSGFNVLANECDLIVILDPDFCNFSYLSKAIRNGCHLFLSDQLKLTIEERRQLVYLANEGGTFIQIQNDFLFHPFQEKILNSINQPIFIEATQVAPNLHNRLDEFLSNNLLMILMAAGSPIHRFHVFCGHVIAGKPDIIHLHIHYKNGSVSTLTLKFLEQQADHWLSIYNRGEITKFDFLNDIITYYPDKLMKGIIQKINSNPLYEQIVDFIRNIEMKKNPGFSLYDEIQVFQLMEKIKEKIELQSYNLQ